MKTRAVVMMKPGNLETREFDIPKPDGKDLIVEVSLVGVCGSDVHMLKGGMDLNFPVIPGHEFAGVISAMGDEAKVDASGKPIKEGDAVTVVPGIVCNECWYCKNVPARPQLCGNRTVIGFTNCDNSPYVQGGMADYLYIDGRASVYKLPEDMPIDYGALAEPLAVSTRGLERAISPGITYAREGFGIGKSIAVQGVGPIGLLAIAAAKAAGAGNIIAVDSIEKRLEMAKAFGADHVVNITELESEDRVQAVKNLTAGEVGPDVVLECTGVPAAMPEGLSMVRKGGKYINIGHYAHRGDAEINPAELVHKDLDFISSLSYPPIEFETALALLNNLRETVPFLDLFNYEVGLEEAEQAFNKQAAGESYRALIRPSP